MQSCSLLQKKLYIQQIISRSSKQAGTWTSQIVKIFCCRKWSKIAFFLVLSLLLAPLDCEILCLYHCHDMNTFKFWLRHRPLNVNLIKLNSKPISELIFKIIISYYQKVMLILNKDIYQLLPNLKVCIHAWLGDTFDEYLLDESLKMSQLCALQG